MARAAETAFCIAANSFASRLMSVNTMYSSSIIVGRSLGVEPPEIERLYELNDTPTLATLPERYLLRSLEL